MKKFLVELPANLPRYRKGLVSLVGWLSAVLTAGFLPEQYARYVSTAVGLLTVVLTVWVGNAPAKTADTPDEALAAQDEPLEGEVLDPYPETVEIPVQSSDTAGIPLIEHDAEPLPATPAPETDYTQLTVDEILARLDAERPVTV